MRPKARFSFLKTLGGTSLYKLYHCADPKDVKVFGPFWSEIGYAFCPFWSGIGYGFRGNYGSVSTCLWFQFLMNKNERENMRICSWRPGLKTCMGLKRSRLKTVVENDVIWSEIGSGFGEPGGSPPPRIPRSTPRVEKKANSMT